MSGGGGGGGGQVTGYRYYFGLHMGICRGPIDVLKQINVGDRPAWYGPVTETSQFYLNNPGMFGNDAGEGGIQGPVDVLFGEADQLPSDGLVAMLPAPVSGFRGMFTLFFNGLVSAMNPYPKAWKVRGARVLKGWDGDVFEPTLALIPLVGTNADPLMGDFNITAMNGAHIIFECFTNRDWGRGLDRAELDHDSFRDAAQTLFDEGLGLCLKWSRTDSLDSFVQGIIDHIGAVVFVSKTTMLVTLRLIRGGYDVASVPLFDSDSGLLKITQSAVAGVGPIINEVQVTYHDPISDTDGKVRAQNVALRQAAGGVVNSTSKTYAGIPIPSLAGRLAQRDLRAASPGLRRMSVVLDRRGYKVEPGSVIRIRDLPRGIKETILRVARVEDGTLASGQITITGVQDVFGFPSTTYLGHEPSTWQAPNRRPCLGRHRVFEMPYVALLKANTTADFNTIEPTSAYVGALMEQGQPLNNGIRIAVKEGAPETSENPSDQTWFCSI